MRIVLDTNVLIAAFISRGTCRKLFEHCTQNHKILMSDFILQELREHFLGKFRFSAKEVEEAVALLNSLVESVIPAPLSTPICRDPKDDVILATALNGNADCILTGDEDLLVLKEFQGIRILRPAEFADFEINET